MGTMSVPFLTDWTNYHPMPDKLVSVIMPAFNAEAHIHEAVTSVLEQGYPNWELLIINDGSTDDTSKVIRSFTDPRIRLIEQDNRGIGAARNAGLSACKGELVCFLDADDVMPPKSIASRLEVFFDHPDTDFVDGAARTMNATLTKELNKYRPSFIGDPYLELISLSGKCFFGNTWLMRWGPDRKERFHEGISHGEDLLFYIAHGPGKRYRYTSETVLLYRRTRDSSMSDLKGLDASYRVIENVLRTIRPPIPWSTLMQYRIRSRRAMLGAFWHNREYWQMVRSLFTRPIGRTKTS